MQRTMALFLVFTTMAAAGYAQAPASSFSDLRTRLAIGETVLVTNRAGEIVKGDVQRLSDTILVVRSGAKVLALAPADVVRIARRGHSVRNGAFIGLAAGFATGAVVAIQSDDCTYTCFSSPAGVLAFGGLFGAIGLGGGAAVGAAFRREQVLFAAPAASDRGRTTIAPWLTPRGVGLGVQIGW